MKKMMHKIKEYVRKAFHVTGLKLKTVWIIIIDGYNKHVYPILHRIGRGLKNNFIVRVTNTHLILFSFIKLKITNQRREGFYGYLFVSIWIVGYLVFTLYPMFYSFFLTTQTAYFNLVTGIETMPNGLKNYQTVLSDGTLLPLFASYLSRMVISVPLIIVFSILIAMLVNQPIKGKGIWRTIFFLPVVITTGPVIGELVSQSATTLPSLSQSSIALFLINNTAPIIANPLIQLFNSMLLILWYAGIPILVMLAGLQKIDKGIYEAASIDGASPWDNFWKITLPSIKPLISVNIIYVVVSMSLYVEEGGILEIAKNHMLQGAPDSVMYKGYGYAATIAWIYFFLMVLIIGIYVALVSVRRTRKRG